MSYNDKDGEIKQWNLKNFVKYNQNSFVPEKCGVHELLALIALSYWSWCHSEITNINKRMVNKTALTF